MGRITDTVKFLLILDVLFFIGTITTGDVAYRLFALYYFESPNFQYWQPLTHMFMHGDFFHILFNMYALWAFGSPLEMRWGQKKFLFFYFSAGLGAALIHTLVNYYHVHTGMEALLGAGLDQNQIFELLNTGKYNTQILNYVSAETIQSTYNAFNTPAVGGLRNDGPKYRPDGYVPSRSHKSEILYSRNYFIGFNFWNYWNTNRHSPFRPHWRCALRIYNGVVLEKK